MDGLPLGSAGPSVGPPGLIVWVPRFRHRGTRISDHMGRWHKFFSRVDLDVLELLREIVRF